MTILTRISGFYMDASVAVNKPNSGMTVTL